MRTLGRSVITALALAVLLAAPGRISGKEAGVRPIHLPDGLEIAVPATWELAGVQSLREYEQTRDAALEAKGIDAKAKGGDARVVFHASKRNDRSTTIAMITVLPGEATQEEIISWAADGESMARLGRILGGSSRQGLVAAGATGIEFGEATTVDAGGKRAVYFTIDFLGPDGREYLGEKYFIYTQQRTVIFSFQSTVQGYGDSQAERIAVLNSLRVP